MAVNRDGLTDQTWTIAIFEKVDRADQENFEIRGPDADQGNFKIRGPDVDQDFMADRWWPRGPWIPDCEFEFLIL